MGRVLKATYEELFLCVMMSGLWWVGQILIITAAPATMGMHAAVNRIATIGALAANSSGMARNATSGVAG